MCSSWQVFNWHSVSRGNYAIAELRVIKDVMEVPYILRTVAQIIGLLENFRDIVKSKVQRNLSICSRKLYSVLGFSQHSGTGHPYSQRCWLHQWSTATRYELTSKHVSRTVSICFAALRRKLRSCPDCQRWGQRSQQNRKISCPVRQWWLRFRQQKQWKIFAEC